MGTMTFDFYWQSVAGSFFCLYIHTHFFVAFAGLLVFLLFRPWVLWTIHQNQKLERIVWPHVKTELQKHIHEAREEWMIKSQQLADTESYSSNSDTSNSNTQAQAQPPPQQTMTLVVVLEAAVLLDADWEDLLDGIWVVTTSTDTALERLVSSRGLSKEEALKRMTAQESRRGIGNLNDEVEKGIVTAIVTNDGSLEELEQALKKALQDPKSWKPTVVP
jgi:dephospho-CoA kinase